MKRGSFFARPAKNPVRPPLGYFRWLAVWGAALVRLLRGRTLAGHAVRAEDAAADCLLRGFPGLLAVPAALFAEGAPFESCVPVAAAGKSEEELLDCIRQLEERSGERFDWDAFLSYAERQARRAKRLDALFSQLRPLVLDASTPAAALRSLAREEGK